jgi:hypothetical protein
LHERIPRNEIRLDRFESLRGELIGFPREGAGQTHKLTGFRHTDNDGFPVHRVGRQLHTTVAKDEHTARLLAFDKEDRVLRISGGRGDGVERGKHSLRKIAENALLHERAR